MSSSPTAALNLPPAEQEGTQGATAQMFVSRHQEVRTALTDHRHRDPQEMSLVGQQTGRQISGFGVKMLAD